jgi:lysophospholipase L1-like esterase
MLSFPLKMSRIAALLLALVALQLPPALLAQATSAPAVAATAADRFWPADGVFPVPGSTSSWSGFRQRNADKRAKFAARAEQDRNAVVFVGDSITDGWTTLEQDFADLGVKVANRGIGGDTTPNLVYRLQDDVLALQPKALVVLIGTNDLGEHTSPQQIAENLGELHRRIRAAHPQIPIAWCLVMPRQGTDTFPDRIKDLNSRIKEMAQSDPRVTLCDTFTPLALPDGSSNPAMYVSDRLHLNPTGYRVWRDALYPIVASWKLGAK